MMSRAAVQVASPVASHTCTAVTLRSMLRLQSACKTQTYTATRQLKLNIDIQYKSATQGTMRSAQMPGP